MVGSLLGARVARLVVCQMIFTIARTYLNDCTTGRMHIDGHVFATMERSRTGDHPCVPEGLYDLVPHKSPKFGNVYAFIGANVYEWAVPEGKEGRCLILLHPGNTYHDLLGCVAPGLSPGHIGQDPAVLNSKAAMGALREMLGTESHTVTIMRAT